MGALSLGLKLQLSDVFSCKRSAIWPLLGLQIWVLKTCMVQSCPHEELQTDSPLCHAGTTLPPWRQAPSMMSKWRPRRSTDDERRSSLCKPKAPGIGGFAVNVSADAGSYHRAPALPTPLAVPARRPSLLGRLGCEAPAPPAVCSHGVHVLSPIL